MQKGADCNIRAFIAANRCGKTHTVLCEMTYHLTGLYPEGWKGRVFNRPVTAWMASVSNEKTRDLLQEGLLGRNCDGTGMIPKYLVEKSKVFKRSGSANAVDIAHIPHVTGGMSTVQFKSYEQGRDTFQGNKVDIINYDEEPKDYEIYSEGLMRLASTEIGKEDGLMILTFTPLLGMSKIARSFLPGGKFPRDGEVSGGKHVTNVTWDDVPHLSEKWKKQQINEMLPHEIEARTKGIPSLGRGAIFPVPESTYLCKRFEIPAWWPKA